MPFYKIKLKKIGIQVCLEKVVKIMGIIDENSSKRSKFSRTKGITICH